MRNVLQIKANGDTNILDLDGPDGSLKTLQKAVGGYIEPITLPGIEMYVNEEFLYAGVPFNPYATSIVRAAYAPTETIDILGDVVMVGLLDDEGSSTGLTETEIDLLREGVERIKAALV